MKTDRYSMFYAYLKEFVEIGVYFTDVDIQYLFNNLVCDEKTCWIDIENNGFFIFDEYDFDIRFGGSYVRECYVDKDSRGQHKAYNTVFKYLQNRIKTYNLYYIQLTILKNNIVGIKFWDKVFADIFDLFDLRECCINDYNGINYLSGSKQEFICRIVKIRKE